MKLFKYNPYPIWHNFKHFSHVFTKLQSIWAYISITIHKQRLSEMLYCLKYHLVKPSGKYNYGTFFSKIIFGRMLHQSAWPWGLQSNNFQVSSLSHFYKWITFLNAARNISHFDIILSDYPKSVNKVLFAKLYFEGRRVSEKCSYVGSLDFFS